MILALANITGGFILIALASALTQREVYVLFERMGLKPSKALGVICGLIYLGLGYILPVYYAWVPLSIYFDLLAVCMVAMILPLVQSNPQNEYEKFLTKTTLPTIFGFIYVPFLLQFFMNLAQIYISLGLKNIGMALVLWVVAVAKFTDVGGYIMGNIIGIHKLAENISPNKTWEGAIGGILFSSFLGVGVVYLWPNFFPYNFTLFIAFLVSLVIGIVSIISDLIESIFKRQAGVKDSSDLIPGIGGAFDLIDSLLLVAPVSYLILKYTLF